MSLSAIQDNLVKTSLVQHTQSRGDEIAKNQENHQHVVQREVNRQEDQVVIHTREAEQPGVRTDEEKEKDGRKKKRQDEEEDEGQAKAFADEEEEDDGPRARMRRINVVC